MLVDARCACGGGTTCTCRPKGTEKHAALDLLLELRWSNRSALVESTLAPAKRRAPQKVEFTQALVEAVAIADGRCNKQQRWQPLGW